MNTATYCTDFSLLTDVSTGEYFNTFTFLLGIRFSITLSPSNNEWLTALYVGSNTNYVLTCDINTAIRPDGYLNTSPVAVTLPVIYKQCNVSQVYVVQMSDFDSNDILKCRWANSSGNVNAADECGGVCSGVPGANLIRDNCTIVFTLTVAYQYAAVALQIEDFYNSAATVPMSSVPLQFLFYGYPAPTSNCITPPAIIGNRPNRGNFEIN
jgi:hypothetical protein